MDHLNRPLARILSVAAVITVAAVLYLPHLSEPDPYLSPDELFIALTAQSVATTGRDLNGRFLPLVFEMKPPFVRAFWFASVPIYSSTAALTVLPLSEATIRLPMAIFAIIEIALVYLVGRQLFQHQSSAIGAAALVVVAPAHFIYRSDIFVAHLPFVIAWLLCLLMHLRNGGRMWIFGSGLILGVGLHTYIAAYVLIPLYGLLTCGVLCMRPQRLRTLAAWAAGFALPAAVGAIVLLWRTTAAMDLFLHYEQDEGGFISALDLRHGFALASRLSEYARVYASFVTPQFWFIGPSAHEQLTRPFLVPVVGLFVAALLRLVMRPTAALLILVGGFLCAPIPASLVAQPESIHRVLAMVPFGALIAMMGLDYVYTAATTRARAAAFTAVWVSTIALVFVYQRDVREAQAVIRAATVPLAVAGLAVMLSHVDAPGPSFRQLAGVGLPMLIALFIAYRVLAYDTIMTTSVVLLSAVCLAPLWPGLFNRIGRHPSVAVAALSLVGSLFVHVYVDYTHMPSIPHLRPSLSTAALQGLAAATASAVLVWLAQRIRPDGASRGRHVIAVVGLVVTQLAYYRLDVSPDFLLRFVQAMVVLAGAVILARLYGPNGGRQHSLGQITAAGLIVFVAIHFPRVYATHFDGSLPQRAAFERAIRRAEGREVPAVYMQSAEMDEMYWRFYALKHRRPDLTRTIVQPSFEVNQLPDIPVGAIAVVERSTESDAVVNEMIAKGYVSGQALKARDGTPSYWILERRAP